MVGRINRRVNRLIGWAPDQVGPRGARGDRIGLAGSVRIRLVGEDGHEQAHR